MSAVAPEPVLVVLVTAPADVAPQLARTLVGERLCACANLLPQVRSVYRWQGAVEEGEETLLVLKTTQARYPELAARLRALHPYQCPECLALPVAAGLPAYLAWVGESVAP